MKKIGLTLILGLILSACGNEEGANNRGISDSTSKEKVEETVVKVENEENTETEVKEEKVVTSNPLTQEEFNQKYELDNDWDQYPNGKYELQDGTIIYADSFGYLGGETFNYASVIFLDGEIAHLQLELKEGVSKEAVLSELGFNEEDVEYIIGKLNNLIVEIVVDDRFADENINRLPSEWD